MKSELQKLLAKRLWEEMDVRKVSANSLAKIAKKLGYKIGQTTISNILAGRQDPTLEKVHAISESLGVPAWFLMTEKGQTQERVIKTPTPPPNVLQLPSRYGATFQPQDSQQKAKNHSKKRR